MSIIDEARAATWLAKNALYVVAGIAALIVLAVFYWFFFVRPAQNAQAAAQAHGQAVVSKHEDQGAHAAVKTISDNAQGETHTNTVTRTNYVYITKQPGAGDPVSDPVWNAFVRSVCMRAAAANDPQCVGLHDAHP